jgi:hypothetical protein
MAGFHRRVRVAIDHGRDARSAFAHLVGGRRRRLAAIALGAMLLLAAIALAAPGGSFITSTGPTGGVTTVGPVHDVNGFPVWYSDKNDIDLEPCIDARDPNCGAVPVPDPSQAPTFPGNFPDEFFYYDATADPALVANGGNKVLAEFALEGMFLGGVTTGNDQTTFERIRFRINGGLQPLATYTISHPYGTDKVKADDAGGLFITQDVGATPHMFSDPLAGRVGPFLTAVNPPAGYPDPTKYIGDSATPVDVTGSPVTQNYLRIEGPGIGGGPTATNPNPCPGFTPTNDCIQTTKFVLTGKRSTTAGVDVARASYSDSIAGGRFIDVFATSKAGKSMVVSAPNGEFATSTLVPDAQAGKRYFARVKLLDGKAVPATVTVTNESDTPVSKKNPAVTDLVTGTAKYDVTAGTLTVTGASSDTVNAALTVAPLSAGEAATPMTAGTATITTPAPPSTVKITSDKGGAATVPVETTGTGASAAAPLVALATVSPSPAQATDTVTFDGTASTGDITGWQWTVVDTATNATVGGVTNGGTSQATFNPPTPGPAGSNYNVTLTVTGAAGVTPATVTVPLHVHPAGAAEAIIAAIGPDVPQNMSVTLDGTGSTLPPGGTYHWSQAVGDPKIAGLPADGGTGKLTFTFPKTTSTLTFKLRVGDLDATGACPLHTCSTATVVLRGMPDDLVATKVRYDAKALRWVVTGTASMTSQYQNQVEVYAGNYPAGTTPAAKDRIGVATVDALGAWAVDTKASSIKNTSGFVTLVSARGGLLVTPVTR